VILLDNKCIAINECKGDIRWVEWLREKGIRERSWV